MSKNKKKYVRRNFYVKKRFQTRFILIFGLLVLAGGFLSTGLVAFFSHGNTTALFSNSHLKITDTSFFLMPALIYANLITIIIISLSVIVTALFVSHKIAGPLFRFEKDIKIIATGDLTHKINLRKKDQLKKLALDINDMSARLGKQINTIKIDLRRAKMLAERQAAPQWFQQDLEKLYIRINQNFKTTTLQEQNIAENQAGQASKA